MVFALKERIFIAFTYFQNNKSIQSVQNQFESEFLDSAKPTKMSALHLVRKFKEYSAVQNQLHVREKTASTPTTLATVNEKLTMNRTQLTSKSLGHVAKEEGISYGTAHHWDLNLEFQMSVALRVITTSE